MTIQVYVSCTYVHILEDNIIIIKIMSIRLCFDLNLHPLPSSALIVLCITIIIVAEMHGGSILYVIITRHDTIQLT